MLVRSRQAGIGAVIRGFELHRLLELLRRFFVLAGAIFQKSETHVAFGASVAQIHRLSARLLGRSDPLVLLAHLIFQPVGLAQARFCLPEVGIEFQGLFENNLRAR